MSLKSAMLAAAKKNAKKVVEKPKKQFNINVLLKGGTTIFTATINGKKKDVEISVHTDNSTYFPQYKFHYRNALGNRVFIKCSKQEHAQMVCDQLEEQKGKYKVSGSAL